MNAGEQEVWDARARRLVEHALAEWEDVEPHSPLGAALACLHIAEGALPPDELDGYPFPGEEPVVECICSPEQLARGGFRGGCPARGVAHA